MGNRLCHCMRWGRPENYARGPGRIRMARDCCNRFSFGNAGDTGCRTCTGVSERHQMVSPSRHYGGALSGGGKMGGMEPADDENSDELRWWLKESVRLGEELMPFVDRVGLKHGDHDWRQKPTKAELVVDELFYFYSASLLNHGEVFSYMDFMIQRRWQFEAIGASGCIAAMDALMPFHREQQALKGEEEKLAYWHETRSDRDSAESLAEDPNVFGQLLLDFARRE